MDSLVVIVGFLIFSAMVGSIFAVFLRRETGLRHQIDALTSAKFEAEKALEIAKKEAENAQRRMQDWEQQKAESIQSAKAAILEAGGQMSSKLLEDHKREQEAAQKTQEAQLQKTTENLFQQFQQVTQTVATLHERTHHTQNKTETLWRALASPTASGQLAEIGLENTLKNLGLEAGRDFILQYHVTERESGTRLRPDAIIFLPQDMVMVVDSKSSKFLLEIAAASNETEKRTALENLKRSMNQHIKDLSAKDYGAFVSAQLKANGRKEHGAIRLLNIMYVPSEAAAEHLKQADYDIMEKLEKAGIILASPASLHGLLSLAKLQIAEARQADNAQKIIEEIAVFIERVVTVLANAEKIGMTLQKATDEFNKMAASHNARLLPSLRKLAGLGALPNRARQLPKPIMAYDIRRIDDPLTLDIEAEETRQPALTEQAEESAV